MGKKVLFRVNKINRYCAEFIGGDNGKILGRYQLCKTSNILLDGKLSEGIIKAYHSYYKDVKDDTSSEKQVIRRNRTLEPVVMDNRVLLICEIRTGVTIAVFKLSNVCDMVKDARFISRLVGVFEEYYKDLRIGCNTEGFYYGWGK